MVKILDIVCAAGVSRATVSRVLNGHANVAPETVQLVKKVMRELDYAPRITRPGPRPKRNNRASRDTLTLGLVLMGRTRELLDEPLNSRMLAGFVSAAQSSQAQTMVLQMPKLTDIPQPIQDRVVDGLCIIGTPPQPEWGDVFHPIPIVAIGGEVMQDTRFDHVLINNAETGRLAARYLMDVAGRNLAYLNHNPAHLSFVSRLEAFRAEAAGAGVSVRIYEAQARGEQEASYWTTPRMRADFSELIDRMLADGGMPDGIYVPADQQAAVLHVLLQERGMSNGAVTISCNNDDPWLSSIHPRPATIDLRAEALGRLAAQRLLARIDNPAADAAVSLLGPRLVTTDETENKTRGDA